MRILFLALDVDMRRQRGETTHTAELAGALSNLGHQVLCLVGQPPLNSPSRDGIRFVGIRGPDHRVVRCALRACASFRPDIIYERRTTPKIGLAIGFIRRLPVVLELNGILKEELVHQGRERALRVSWLRDVVRGVLIRHVDRFVAVGTAIAEDLARSHRLPRHRIHVVGNGVNVDRFRPLAKLDACRSTGLDPGRPRMVFVGNLVPWRDLHTVLESVPLILASQPDAELIVVGDGQERSRLEEEARALPRGSVVFTGEVPNDKVPIFISAADVCLLPERSRSLDISPLKLFEYLACARPVIGFDVAGVSFVGSEQLGVIIPGGDAKSLAAEVLRLFGNPDECQEMGRRGREYVERNRSWDVVARSIESILSEMVEA